ncbi:hypothetical protein [Hymenobacter sp. BT190]|uniref:hypothetical protein n=1 Tax=Hymenobacter sp. BT190 TaxID=2763505 RepID=UPI0016512E0B|nr:hypothetical protein [Hymenobacter sp. BT190]MBC6696780.1 hypothetical protein [Hymenobacter sp. BT190]
MRHVFPFLLGLWLVAASPLQAQPTTPAPYTPTQNGRLELELQEYAAEVEVQPILQDSSVLLLVKQDEPGIRNDTYALQKYNHRLQPVWNNKLELPVEFQFQRFCAEGTTAYALFQSAYVEHRLLVAAVDGGTGRVRTVQFDSRLTRDIYDLKALAGNLFVTVLVDNHLTILLLDLATGKHQFLPSVYEPLPAQLSFLADSAAQRAEFVLSQSNGFKNRLQLKRLSAGGALLTSEFVQAESERGLISAQISPATDSAEGRLLAGTYTLRDPRYSQGLFAADLTAGVNPSGSRRSLRFYDFSNLKHFFDFMSPNRASRLRQRSEKMRAADRVLRLRYRTLMHDLVPFEDGYVMVAEIYFPHYRYNSYSPSLVYNPYYYSAYDRANWASGNRNFDGYRITHALICGFDKRGNLLWDNTLVMKNVELRDLTETVRLRQLPDGRLAAAYLQNDKLYYKVIDRASPSPNDLSVNLTTSALPSAREKATNTTQEGLTTWYGNRLLAYGFQHVRAEHGPDRDVFFLNTISFE